MRNVVIGLLGSTLDQGFSRKRWEYWRPSIGVCMHEDLLVDEFHLLFQGNFKKLALQVREDILSISPETDVVLHHFEFKNPWDFEEVYSALLDFSKKFAFDVDRDDYLIHITTGTHVVQICMFLLTESRHFPGKLLQTAPDEGGRSKCCRGSYTIIDLDLSKYDKIASRFHQETKDDISFLKSGIDTKNTAFNRLIERIEKVALCSKEPILLMGPTGAGKSQLAGRIYQLKKLRGQVQGRFVEINCATLRGDAAMSALFGHKKGSFTGAVQDRAGLLKSADKGLVLLDEIGELGADEQAMLLRAIEEKTFTPLGSDTETRSNFQLICGTNKDLYEYVKKGKFREDLLSRINLWTFRLPGLKDRLEDIEPNIHYELNHYEELNGIHVTFSKEARELFLQFAVSAEALWSSNFRDLNGAVIRMCTLAPGGRITREICLEEIQQLKANWYISSGVPQAQDLFLEDLLKQKDIGPLDPFDRIQLEYVINTCRRARSLSEAGRILYSHSRLKKSKTNDADRLTKYLAKFLITWNDILRLQT